MTAQEMRERRAELLSRRKQLHETAVGENRDLSDVEQAEFDKAGTDAESYARRIAQAELIESEQAELNASTRTVYGNEPLVATNTPSITVRERVLDDPRRGFRSFGDYACTLFSACRPGAADFAAQKRLFAATGANQNSGADGGYLVPPEFSTAIWDGLNTGVGSLLPMTDTYTITGESLTLNANAETSRATGSRYGGIQGYWIAEADQMTASRPKLRQVKLEPQQLAVLVYATDKLLANAPAMTQYLSKAATEEINFLVSDSIIEGNGAGKPLGIINAACTVSVSKETGQSASTIVKNNIDKMWSRLNPKSQGNAVWFINIDCQPQLDNLSMVVGTGGVPVYLPPGGLSDSPLGRLKGRPVIPLEYCSTVGTVGDIILADLKAYASGTQGTLETASSMHLRFDYNETAFRFVFAVCGQPWLAAAMTPFKGSATVSPFVTLATRA